MIANYGFEDGTGSYYISVDHGQCALCPEQPCLDRCPAGVLGGEADDFDDMVAVVKEEFRHQIQVVCAECHSGGSPLPCVEVCPGKALRHSW